MVQFFIQVFNIVKAVMKKHSQKYMAIYIAKKKKQLLWLAIVALLCTLLVATFIFIESATDSDESAAQSGFLADTIKNVADINDNDGHTPTKSIKLSPSGGNHLDDTMTPKIEFHPTGASDREVIFSSGDESIAEIVDNKVHFVGVGSVSIRAELKSDPSIFDVVTLLCVGLDPKKITALTASPTVTLNEGAVTHLTIRDQLGNLVTSDLKATSDNPDVVSATRHRVAARQAGVAHIEYTVNGGNESAKCSVTVTVKDVPSYNKPTSFVYNGNMPVKDGEVELEIGKRYSVSDIVSDTLPSGSAFTYYAFDCSLINENPKKPVLSANNSTSTSFTVSRPGTAKITLKSLLNPECKETLTVSVPEPTPTKLTIVGKDRIVVDEAVGFEAFGDDTYISDVTWSVVKGKATLLGDGMVRASKLGTLVLRVTSNRDSSVYAELTITVSLFSNFGLFVRKMIGHFGLFMVLGFGLAATFFLFIRIRYIYPLPALVLGFGSAVLSEVLQLPIFAEGRFASWTDVFIDTMGVLAGVIFFTVVILIYLLIRRKTKSYPIFKAALFTRKKKAKSEASD